MQHTKGSDLDCIRHVFDIGHTDQSEKLNEAAYGAQNFSCCCTLVFCISSVELWVVL